MSHSSVFRVVLLLTLTCFPSSLFSQNGPPPGILISKSDDPGTRYVSCPCLAILPNGTYIASHAWWLPKKPGHETVVFQSKDRGRNWEKLSTIDGQFGSTIFEHDGDLYLLGATKHWNNIVIRRSKDGGRTWTNPTDASNGLLSIGQYYSDAGTMPVFAGRIWRTFEQAHEKRIRALTFSAPTNSNLLDASSWRKSNLASITKDHFGGKNDRLFHGNLVPMGDGTQASIMRTDAEKPVAAILTVSGSGRNLNLDTQNAFVDMPGSRWKFVVRYDQQSKRYWSIVNKDTDPFAMQNVLALVSSTNMRDWKVETILRQHIDCTKHGFYKTFWQFDGDDIIAAVGTGWGVGHAHLLCFHRFNNFRTLKMTNSAKLLGPRSPFEHETAKIIINGINWSVHPLELKRTLFFDSGIRLKSIPKRHKGWNVTRIKVGSRTDMSVFAKQTCEVFFATGLETKGAIDVTGWTPTGDMLKFNNEDEMPMTIYKRSAKAGERIQIPQGNWTGGVVLFEE